MESSSTLDASEWTTVETMAGTGVPVTRYLTLRNAPERLFFRLKYPANSPTPIAHRDLPDPNTLFFEDFNGPDIRSFLTLRNGMSYSGNSLGLGHFAWNGATNDPQVIFTQLYGSIDFLTFGNLRIRHRYTGGAATTFAWVNPAKGGEDVRLSVQTNLQTFSANRALPVPGDGGGMRIDPGPWAIGGPTGTWDVDYIALDRGRTLGWEFDETGNARGGVNCPVAAYGFAGITDGAPIEGADGNPVAGGVFSAATATADARIELLATPTYGLSNHLETATYEFVELRLRASAGGQARLLFANGSGGWDSNRPSFELPDDGLFHTYLFDFRNDPAWHDGNVTAFAIALPEIAGLNVDIDYIRFLQTAAAPDEPADLAIRGALELEIPLLPSGLFALQASTDGIWTTEEEIASADTPTARFRPAGTSDPQGYRLAAKGQPPQLVEPPPPQTATAGTPLVIDLPAGTFEERDGHSIRYSAQLRGALPLPDWLSVDPETGQITGAPPLYAISTLELEILADDQIDGSAMASITLAIEAPDPVPPGPTAALYATQLSQGKVPDPAECWTFGDAGRLSEWVGVRTNLAALKLYIDTVNSATPQQLQAMAAVTSQHGIRVAIEMGGLLDWHCLTGDTINAGELSFATEMAKIQRWLDAGGSLHHLEFDDPINRAFYPKNAQGQQVETGLFTLATATRELIDAMSRYRAALPNVRFVYLPNFPNWGWNGGPAYYNFGFSPGPKGRGDLRPVLDHVLGEAAQRGLPFWAVCADHPREYFLGTHSSNQTTIKNTVNWSQRVRDLETYTESKGLRFLLIVNDETAGATSGAAFQTAVADYVSRYKAAGGSPSAYNIQSWYSNPTITLPETIDGRLARVILAAFGQF